MPGSIKSQKGKPIIRPEQAVGGAGAKPQGAARFPKQGASGVRGVEANTARSKGVNAPDHRSVVSLAVKQKSGASDGVYTKESR